MNTSSVVGLIVFNLGFTIILYCLFPVLFAAFRKKQIKIRTYNFISFAVNILLAFFVKASSDPISIGTIQHKNYSLAPCFIWTTLAVAIGMRILRKKSAIYEENELTKRYICKACGTFSAIPLSECPKCGDKHAYIDRYSKTAVPVDRRFRCQKCGAEFSDRRNNCPKCGADKIIERPTIPFVGNDEKEKQVFIESAEKTGTRMLPSDNIGKNSFTNTATENVPASLETGKVESDTLPVVKFCRECGTRLARDAVYCFNCGTKVIQYPVPGISKNEEGISRSPDDFGISDK